ncbi:MAG: 16S rRNA (guanine(527)-N(7))-methyltransferase RsmG [Evtepia sp.]
MTEQALEILRQGLDRLGLTYPPDAVERLALYGDRLLEKNQVMNLTAITDPCEVARLHFLDSASLLPSKTLHGRKVIDVGTGGGFPGLVLVILDPSIRLTLLDSLGKRIDWLQEVCEELGLHDVVCLKGRAEETARQKNPPGQYDVRSPAPWPSHAHAGRIMYPLCEARRPLPRHEEQQDRRGDRSRRADHPNPGGRQALCHGLSGAGDRHLAPYRHRGKARPTQASYPGKWTKIKESKI